MLDQRSEVLVVVGAFEASVAAKAMAAVEARAERVMWGMRQREKENL